MTKLWIGMIPQSGYYNWNLKRLTSRKMCTYPHLKSLAQFLKINYVHTMTETY